jgi:outer membrane receptor for ferrienterochelin and colicins
VDGEYVPAAELGTSTTDFTYFNQDQFKSLGMNFGLDLHWKEFKTSVGFAPIGRYNILPDNVEDVEPLSYVLESNADMSYHIPSLALSFHFYIKHNNKLIRYYVDVDENGESFTNQTEYDGYYLADINLVKKFWKNNIQFNLGVKNLFDVTNINFTDLNSPAPGDLSDGQFPIAKGRQYHAGLIIHLSGN